MKRAEALRQEVMKLPGGKGGSFPVERKEASRWRRRKLPSGKEEASRQEGRKLYSGKL